eukprot:575789-Alexandrium_andersonii.AAC.1
MCIRDRFPFVCWPTRSPVRPLIRPSVRSLYLEGGRWPEGMPSSDEGRRLASWFARGVADSAFLRRA